MVEEKTRFTLSNLYRLFFSDISLENAMIREYRLSFPDCVSFRNKFRNFLLNYASLNSILLRIAKFLD